jgi:hypothetical protein
MHRETATRYLAAHAGPEALKKPHLWRTRSDPMAAIWLETERRLEERYSLLVGIGALTPTWSARCARRVGRLYSFFANRTEFTATQQLKRGESRRSFASGNNCPRQLPILPVAPNPRGVGPPQPPFGPSGTPVPPFGLTRERREHPACP